MTRNLTLAVEEELLDRYRSIAQRRGTTVNAMIRAHMAATVGMGDEAKRAAVARMRERARHGPKAESAEPMVRGWGDHED